MKIEGDKGHRGRTAGVQVVMMRQYREGAAQGLFLGAIRRLRSCVGRSARLRGNLSFSEHWLCSVFLPSGLRLYASA